MYNTDSIPRIINMTTEKGITYFALRISYPDGSNEYIYHVREKDLASKEKPSENSEGFKAYLDRAYSAAA